jgi:hypothetical protein
MIKKLICFLWGCKTVHRGYTGETIGVDDFLTGARQSLLYRWERTPFCTRCGKPTEEEAPEKAERDAILAIIERRSEQLRVAYCGEVSDGPASNFSYALSILKSLALEIEARGEQS